MRFKNGKRRWILTALFGAVLVLGAGGAIGGTLLEDHDDFCISCHTTPEQTYYDRVRQALKDKAGGTDLKNLAAQRVAIDLASQHYIVTDTMSCISCHGGVRDFGDRADSLTLGVKDTFKFFLGRADQTIEKTTTGDPALINRACVGCHVTQLVTVRFANHFHVKLPQAWNLIQSGVQLIVAADTPQVLTDPRSKPELLNTSITCLSCHQAHRSNLDLTGYLDQDAVVLQACAACHRETGKGPVGIAPP